MDQISFFCSFFWYSVLFSYALRFHFSCSYSRLHNSVNTREKNFVCLCVLLLPNIVPVSHFVEGAMKRKTFCCAIIPPKPWRRSFAPLTAAAVLAVHGLDVERAWGRFVPAKC